MATKSVPGVPMSVAGVSASDPSLHLPPPVDSDFGRIAVNRIKTDSQPGTVLIEFTVTPAACRDLLEKVGGRCGDRTAPVRGSGEAEISTLGSGDEMSADFWLSNPGPVSLAESGALTNLGVPTSWALESEGPAMRVSVSCGEATLLLSAGQAQRVKCAYVGARYTLPLRSAEAVAPSLFLTDVSHLDADLEGTSVSIEVGEGELSRDGEFETLASAKPLEVDLKSSADHPVDLAAHSDAKAGAFNIAMSDEQARSIEWGGEDHTRSLLDRQPELAYALFGVVAGFFLVTLADFVFALLMLLRVS